MLWHPRHSLSSFIWLEWDVFPTCFWILLRITCWQLWQTASNSHILWCLQPEHTPNVSGVSDTRLGLTSLHTSTFSYEMPLRWLPPRGSPGGIKVRWKEESLHLCSVWMSVFLKASGRGWTTQSVEMPTRKPNSRLILSESNCKQGVQELVMLFLYVRCLIKCGMNEWRICLDQLMSDSSAFLTYRECLQLCPEHPRASKQSWSPDPYEQITSSQLIYQHRLYSFICSFCQLKTAFFLSDWKKLCLDDKTANKMLWISDGGSKVCRRTEEVCPVLDRPERYEYSPQVRHTYSYLFTWHRLKKTHHFSLLVCFPFPSKVVCKEVIWNMRAYWEVEFSGWVVIGATYEGAGRRASSGPSGLGENEESWGLCWSGTQYEIWFNGIKKDITNVPFCSTIGVYLDQPAGIISFYAVTGEGAEREAQLLHKVETSMDQRILPGFWIGIQSSCTILKIPEWNVIFYLFKQMSGIVCDHMHHFSSCLDDKLCKCLLEKYFCIALSIIVDTLLLLRREINHCYKWNFLFNPEWFRDFWSFSGWRLHCHMFALLLNGLTLICTKLKFKEPVPSRDRWDVRSCHLHT